MFKDGQSHPPVDHQEFIKSAEMKNVAVSSPKCRYCGKVGSSGSVYEFSSLDNTYNCGCRDERASVEEQAKDIRGGENKID